jgi:dihydroorotate dehydrogenase (NAD+) catalytic subunit
LNRTREWFETPYRLGEKKVSGRFVVPSGIRCTHASTIARCFQEVPSIGVITTKSISLAPKAGYREPIFAQYAEGSYINAVGLTNPGASAFRAELETVDIPADKFLLVSIFGASVSDFVEAARILEPVADGFELNMSCPHAKGYGAEIGADRALLCEITRAVVAAVRVPVFVKFSAILGDLAGAAAAVIAEGASGIAVTNTIGPALVKLGDAPVLRNGLGGLSGDGIRPLGVRAVLETRAALGLAPVIIGMGGISNHHHIREYASAGADLFGVGSATAWLDSLEYAQYFSRLLSGAIESPAARSASQVSNAKPRIEYFDSRLESREDLSEDLFRVSFTDLPAAYPPGSLAGKFFFIMLPGVGEKPFAVFSAAERSVIVRTVGEFTEELRKLEAGSKLFLRGPYGKPLPRLRNKTIVLVGGGTGTASLLEIALDYKSGNELAFVLGARSGSGFFGLDEFRALGPVHLATNDGSIGYGGNVHEALLDLAPSLSQVPSEDLVFINCGPEKMVKACFAVELKFADSLRIFGSIEYMTSCGVGICGKCASPSGALTCIDGPFLSLAEFQSPGNAELRGGVANSGLDGAKPR